MARLRSRTAIMAATAFLTAGLALAPAARADQPQTETKSLATLETMVGNLGYTTTDATDKSHFWIEWQGKYNYRIDFQVSNDGEMVYLYTYIDTWTPDQLAKVPYMKMLEFQNIGNVYFSMQNTGKGEDFYVNEAFSMPGLTPASLRGQLEYFVKQIDGSDNLWNTKLWSASAAH